MRLHARRDHLGHRTIDEATGASRIRSRLQAEPGTRGQHARIHAEATSANTNGRSHNAERKSYDDSPCHIRARYKHGLKKIRSASARYPSASITAFKRLPPSRNFLYPPGSP